MERFLVTGALGCIGAWVLRHLVREGSDVVATDIAADPIRPRLLLAEPEMEKIQFRRLDITDLSAVELLVAQEGISHIIHLAGLQVPFCRATPSLGAQVNVVGTVNIFEAARKFRDQLQGLAYASSIAVFGPPELYPDRPVGDGAPPSPRTLYGVYKVADEGVARVFWQDWAVPSVGLRPYVVFGVGRDQGITADLAKAILAAVLGREFRIKFGGMIALQYAPDIAEMFVRTARSSPSGGDAFNVRNDVVSVSRFVEVLKAAIPGARISFDPEKPLPFPCDMDDGGLRLMIGQIPHTPLEEAIADTARRFRVLLQKNAVDLRQLDN